MIIGITGKAGVGKDTLANHLVLKHGFIRYGFADPIKKLLNARFGWAMEDWENREWKEAPMAHCGHPQSSIINNFSPRSWAQWLGTEVGRESFGDYCWINLFKEAYEEACFRTINTFSPKFVIPDVRFENEARAIINMGGSIIHLHRPNTTPVNSHISETPIRPQYWSASFSNSGSIQELQDFGDLIVV